MAIILNTETRVITVPDDVRPVRLLPGANNVDNAVWERARPHVLTRLGVTFTEIGVEVKKDAKGKEAGISFKKFEELSVKEASELVKKTLDVKTLHEWKSATSREDIRREILDQIEEMEKRGGK